jgi:hypothetical protein
MTESGKNGGLDMKRRYWAEQIRAWEESPLSQAEYCRRQRISIKSFQYWKSKLGRHEEIKLVPVPAVIASGRKLPDIVQTGKSVTPLVLHIGEIYRLDIGKGFDEETFCRVIGLL